MIISIDAEKAFDIQHQISTSIYDKKKKNPYLVWLLGEVNKTMLVIYKCL